MDSREFVMASTPQEKAAEKRQEKIDATMRRLTEQMVAALEAGMEDESWQPPWHSASFSAGARNVATGNQYRGGNWLLLALLEASDPETFAGPWGTFAQWKSVDACVVFSRGFGVIGQ